MGRSWATMTCTNPAHETIPKCTKSASVSKFGAEVTLRMLKAWVVRGYGASSKTEHQSVWAEVLEAARSGSLPQDQDLEAMAVIDWDNMLSMRETRSRASEAHPSSAQSRGQSHQPRQDA